VASQDELSALMEAVDQLPDSLREALLIYYYCDVTYEDLGTMLGVSSATVNARLTKARSVLREKLLCRGGAS
jgi:RNA polymerase sigma-70 factor (ECF subfamily)